MKKQIMTLALAGALALGSAGLASAACINPGYNGDGSCADLNIYGASAQFNFYQAEIAAFLASATGGNCTVPNFSSKLNGKQFFQIGTQCGAGHNQSIVMRLANKASFDGVASISGQDLVGTGITNYAGDPDANGSATTGAPGGCQTVNLHERTFCNETDPTCTAVACQTVNVGAADVAFTDFVQTSTSAPGNIIGPYGHANGTEVYTGVPAPFNRTFPSSGMEPGAGGNLLNDTLINSNQPFIIPFSFFVNNDVKVSKCTNAGWAGHLCTGDATDCGSTPAACVSNTLDNMTHPMAVMIFSRQADSWTDFGPWFVAGQTLDVCVRHAGSGSHAMVDWTIMHGEAQSGNDDTIMGALANVEGATGVGLSGPGYVWFNDGTGDNMNCANRVAYPLACTAAGTPYLCCTGAGPAASTGCPAHPGSVTYADSDQALSTPAYGSTKYANVVELKYQGEYGRHNSLVNGMYDFYTHEHAYTSANSLANAGTATVWTNFQSYIAGQQAAGLLPGSTSATPDSSEAAFWAYPCQMTWDKGNNQFYPGVVGTSCPNGDL